MFSTTRRLVAGVAALALLAGGGAAYGAGSQAAAKSGRGAMVAAISSYLGLSAQQLRADLRSGETLAQVATAQGKTVSGLEQTIESTVKTWLDKAVAAGKITSSQEQQILTRLQTRLDKLVNTVHPGAVVERHRWLRGMFRVSASYLGLSGAQLKADLKAGQTLAQVATAQGKTVAGLEQAITTAVKTRLDKAVAAGKITSQREQQILNRLPARLDKLVNHNFNH